MGTLCAHRPCQGYTHNPTGFLCVHRDKPAIPLGSMCIYRDVPSYKPPIKMPFTSSLPHSCLYVFVLYILQETARLSVCAHQLQGPYPQQTPSQNAPHNLSPPSLVLYLYWRILRLSVCAHQVQGSILWNFVAFWPTCVVLSRYVVRSLGEARVVFSHPGF